jgi:hypothetical protein
MPKPVFDSVIAATSSLTVVLRARFAFEEVASSAVK